MRPKQKQVCTLTRLDINDISNSADFKGKEAISLQSDAIGFIRSNWDRDQMCLKELH